MSAGPHWHDRPEGGGLFALWLIRGIALHAGRRVARAFLYPITLYFYLRRGPERRASREYLARALGRAPGRREVLRHIHCFAATILDRVFFLARGEEPFQVDVEGLAAFESALARGTGVLLLGSHQGSFEALRTLAARRPDLQLRIVLDKGKTPALTALLEALAPDLAARVIDASRGGIAVALAVGEACRSGAVVALLADRGHVGEALRAVDFMGAPAAFPVGPWQLAASLGVPVLLGFGLYLGGNRYHLVFEPFAARVDLPRHARGPALDALLAAYAGRLEHWNRRAPYNWFNFYDFWQTLPAPAPAPAEHEAGARCGDAGVDGRARV